GDHLDLAGADPVVDRVAGADDALDLDHVLVAEGGGDGEDLGVVGLDRDLDDAFVVAQVDEADAAEVAGDVGPAGEGDGLADQRFVDQAAEMGTHAGSASGATARLPGGKGQFYPLAPSPRGACGAPVPRGARPRQNFSFRIVRAACASKHDSRCPVVPDNPAGHAGDGSTPSGGRACMTGAVLAFSLAMLAGLLLASPRLVRTKAALRALLLAGLSLWWRVDRLSGDGLDAATLCHLYSGIEGAG